MKERNPAIDVAKGIAIIAVVIGHVVTSYHNSNLMMDEAIPNYLCKLVYSFHMPLFFMVSGYLVSTKEFVWAFCWPAVRKNLISYGIPYVAFCVFSFVFKLAFSGSVNTAVSFTDLLLIPLYPIGMMWFLYALLVVSVLHILMTCTFSNKNKRMFAELSISAIVLVFAAYVGKSDLGIYDSAKYWFWYSFGIYFCPNIVDFLTRTIKLSSCCLMGGAFCVVIFLLPEHDIKWLSFATTILMAMCGSLIVWQSAKLCSNNKLLNRVGQLSLPIYLIHGYVISLTRILLTRAHFPDMGGIVPLIVCTFLGVCIPIIVYNNIVKRTVFLDFFVRPNKYLSK